MPVFPVITTAIAVGFITFTIGKIFAKVYKIAKRVGHLEQRVSSLRLLNDNGDPYRSMPLTSTMVTVSRVLMTDQFDLLNQIKIAISTVPDNHTAKSRLDTLAGRAEEMMKRLEAETHVE